jgi:hypothetical protein
MDLRPTATGKEPKAVHRSYRFTMTSERRLQQAMLALGIKNETKAVELAIEALAEKLNIP